MVCHIARNGSPINSTTYDTREAALAAFGDEYEWLDGDRIKSRGLIYEVVDRENPKTARAAAAAARPAGWIAPTDKQIALVSNLARQVGGGSIAVRLGALREGNLSRKDTSRLIDDMLAEARG